MEYKLSINNVVLAICIVGHTLQNDEDQLHIEGTRQEGR
jgi:hypothetical protein